jgi:hypothetical protein
MRGRSPINSWMFIEKPLECRSRDRRRRTPSDFPLLQCRKFGGYAGRSENADCFGLAEIIGLAPRFEAQNDRCGRSLRSRCFVLLGKEPFKGCRSHGLGEGAEPRFTIGRNVISQEVEEITSSSGDVFEQKLRDLKKEKQIAA